jgi:hypothetical protein
LINNLNLIVTDPAVNATWESKPHRPESTLRLKNNEVVDITKRRRQMDSDVVAAHPVRPARVRLVAVMA